MIDGDVRPASVLGGCFSVVNKDKASVSRNQPAGHFVWWSSGVKRKLWAGGWYGSVRINDQITTNHNAIAPCLSTALSHSHTVRVWHTLPEGWREQRGENRAERNMMGRWCNQRIVDLGGECLSRSRNRTLRIYIIIIISVRTSDERLVDLSFSWSTENELATFFLVID